MSSLVLVFTFVISPIAVAQIVDPDISISASGLPNQFGLDFANSSTLFEVTPSSTNGFADVTFASTDLGVGRRWFDAELGQSFSCATIDNFQIIGSNEGGVPAGSVEVPLGSDFYLAINTGDFDLNGEPLFDQLGWAQLNVDQNLNLSAVDGALSLSCEGIIIGVPEPELGMMAMFLFASFITLTRRTRRSD